MSRSSDEVLEDIFKLLPVKTLLRFKSACKPWHSRISSPYFAKRHFCYQSQTPKQEDPTMRFLLVKEDESPPHDDDVPFRFLGCCDGLVFGLRKPYGVLWNPATRQCMDSLEWPEPDRFSLVSNCISGLVHHDSDYKAILAYSYKYLLKVGPVHDQDFLTKAWVLSMKSRKWTMVDCPYVFCQGSSAANLRGTLHWVVKSFSNEPASRIICFDMSDFKFNELMQPDYHHMRYFTAHLEVGTFRGKLCFYHCGSADGYANSEHTCTVWVMNEYGVKESWIKLFVVPAEIPFLDVFQPLSIITRNDQFVLIGMINYGLRHPDIRIMSIGFEENSGEKITVVAKERMVEPIHCIDYTPSLFWIDTCSSDREGLPPPIDLVPADEFIPKTGSVSCFS